MRETEREREREGRWKLKMKYNIKQIFKHNTITKEEMKRNKYEKREEKKKTENHQIKKGNEINGQNYEKLKRCWFKYCRQYSASNGVSNGFTKRLEIMMALFYIQWMVYINVCVCVCVSVFVFLVHNKIWISIFSLFYCSVRFLLSNTWYLLVLTGYQYRMAGKGQNPKKKGKMVKNERERGRESKREINIKL